MIRVGIIGCGGAGRAHYWRFNSRHDSRVVAVFDPKPDKVRQFLAASLVQTPPHLTNDWNEFVARSGVEVVSICSPDAEHAKQAIDCLNRGFHVLVEKPMATSSADAARMIAAAKAAGRQLMVHHQMRYLPVFRKAKELAAQGVMGRIFGLEADYYHDMRKRAVALDDWRVRPGSCQNIVFGGACHPLDLMQWVAGDRIKEVFAYANHLAFTDYPDVDTVVAVLRFSAGAVGRMTMTIGCNRPSEHTLVVLGDGGSFVNGLLLRTQPRQPSVPLMARMPSLLQRFVQRVAQGVRHEATMTHFPTETTDVLQRFCDRWLMRCGNVLHFPHSLNEHSTACQSLIGDFLQSVTHATPPPIDPLDSQDTIRVCEAVIQSYQTGQPVSVNRGTM